ncbi:MAG: ECF transporter S component [Armatimonadetes bacterium]|nr:ECF transporter S component [Armatimonadota bacterium]
MKYSARDLAVGGLFGAVGVALPIVFHAVGLGRAFLPMHLPVLVGGLLVSPAVAFAVGVVTPLVSSGLTGMPPMVPTAFLMTLELGALAGIASISRRLLRLPVMVSVIFAMVAARVIGALELLAIAPLMGMKQSPVVYLTQSVVLSLPGIALQLVAAPIAVAAINRISPEQR